MSFSDQIYFHTYCRLCCVLWLPKLQESSIWLVTSYLLKIFYNNVRLIFFDHLYSICLASLLFYSVLQINRTCLVICWPVPASGFLSKKSSTDSPRSLIIMSINQLWLITASVAMQDLHSYKFTFHITISVVQWFPPWKQDWAATRRKKRMKMLFETPHSQPMRLIEFRRTRSLSLSEYLVGYVRSGLFHNLNSLFNNLI